MTMGRLSQPPFVLAGKRENKLFLNYYQGILCKIAGKEKEDKLIESFLSSQILRISPKKNKEKGRRERNWRRNKADPPERKPKE